MDDRLAIDVRDLVVSRGGNPVLRSVSLSVRRGVIAGLLGPSGCGKTTLMRAIVGVQKLAGGSVTVLVGEAGSRPLRSRVGYVTQAPSVYRDLTVTQNLAYFARITGAEPDAIARVIDQVGLGASVGRVVARLSGGQQARASLGSAMLNSPELLVLDEPTVGLDPVLRNSLWSTFRTLADSGVTLLVSSHVMDEAERCDELILMCDGKIVAAEAPAELLRQTGESRVEEAFLRIIEREQPQ